jgi:D-aminopeptidase
MRKTLKDLQIRVGRLAPGATDSIVDVAGFTVGHVTLTAGDGPLAVGRGPVRTGVTVLVPPSPDGPWTAAAHVVNGFGKSQGLMQLAELGQLESPIFLTNTLGVAAVLQGYLEHVRDSGSFRPASSRNVVVCECNDGFLNDLWGLHVKPEHARAALAAASANPPAQGAVGAGTGMAGFGMKGGIGTASRRLPGGGVLGALVLLNCGRADELVTRRGAAPPRPGDLSDGSIIMVLATDAGLDRWDLARVARRATHGLARTGAHSAPGSGDVVVAVDTGAAGAAPASSERLDSLFLAAAEATEAAIWNALLTAETTVGRDGHVLRAMPVEWAPASWPG